MSCSPPERTYCGECFGTLEEGDEGLCSECQEPSDNGEGWDGLCGTCADMAENKRDGSETAP